MSLIIPDSGYYVYTLSYPDGKIFYIGKGKNHRIYDHLSEARNQCQCRKCHIIRAIWRAKHQIQLDIIFTSEDEDEAFLYEKILIKRHQHKRLVNKAPGGRGGTSTPEYRKAPQKQVTKYIERQRQKGNILREQLGLAKINYD